MAKRTKKTGERRARRPRLISTVTLAESIGTRSLDELNALAAEMREKFPWGSKFLASRLKDTGRTAVQVVHRDGPQSMPGSGPGELRDPQDFSRMPGATIDPDELVMPETHGDVSSHTTRMDAINKEANADV